MVAEVHTKPRCSEILESDRNAQLSVATARPKASPSQQSLLLQALRLLFCVLFLLLSTSTDSIDSIVCSNLTASVTSATTT